MVHACFQDLLLTLGRTTYVNNKFHQTCPFPEAYSYAFMFPSYLSLWNTFLVATAFELPIFGWRLHRPVPLFKTSARGPNIMCMGKGYYFLEKLQ